MFFRGVGWGGGGGRPCWGSLLAPQERHEDAHGVPARQQRPHTKLLGFTRGDAVWGEERGGGREEKGKGGTQRGRAGNPHLTLCSLISSSRVPSPSEFTQRIIPVNTEVCQQSRQHPCQVCGPRTPVPRVLVSLRLRPGSPAPASPSPRRPMFE